MRLSTPPSGVTRMTGEPGIEDGLQVRMIREPGREHRRGRARAFHADEKRPHAAREEPGLERPEDVALEVTETPDARPGLVVLRGDDRAREHVAMTIQEFRRRVHDPVGAEGDR